MGKPTLSKQKQDKIKNLRKKGYSVKEISQILSIGVGTSSKYCKDVYVQKSGLERLDKRRYPSKTKSLFEKETAIKFVRAKIGKINDRDLFLIASSLYWGEGTKKELNLINGDPELIKVFIFGLLKIGVKKEDLKINIRYYSNQNKMEITDFWLKSLGLSGLNLVGYEKVDSFGSNKLVHGMCRVRVLKSSYFHKVLTSAIKVISSGSSNG